MRAYAKLLLAGLLSTSYSHGIMVTELTNTPNNGKCSLTEAIAVANLNVGTSDCPVQDNDLITFNATLFSQLRASDSISLARIEIDTQVINITDDLTIQAPSVAENEIIIDEYDLIISMKEDPVRNTPFFQLTENTQLTLKGIQFNGSSSPSAAFATLNSNSQLNFINSELKSFGNYDDSLMNTSGLINTADASHSAIINIEESQFHSNFAYGNGVIIRANAEKILITDSVFDSNRAAWNGSEADGGIIAIDGTSQLEVKSSLFARNSAEGNGGVIANLSATASVKIENSNFINNFSLDAGGAIYNQGQLSLYSNAFLKNQSDAYKKDNTIQPGGALYNSVSSSSSIYNTLFALNYIYGSDTVSDCRGAVDVIEYSFINSNDGCSLPVNTLGSLVDSEELPTIYTVKDKDDKLIGYSVKETLVDAADPSGCIGMDGKLLTTDINGNNRAQNFSSDTARCDIGSTEIAPLSVAITAEKTNYSILHNSVINLQDPVFIKLTLKNLGENNLKDINIGFSTPTGFAVKSRGSIKSGNLELFFDVDIAPGEEEDVFIEVVAINNNSSGEFNFQVFSEVEYVELSPSYSDTQVTVNVSSSSNANSSPGSEESTSSSSGGAMWLLPLLALFRRRK